MTTSYCQRAEGETAKKNTVIDGKKEAEEKHREREIKEDDMIHDFVNAHFPTCTTRIKASTRHAYPSFLTYYEGSAHGEDFARGHSYLVVVVVKRLPPLW